MANSLHPRPRRSRPPFDSAFEKEESHVRQRGGDTQVAPLSGQATSGDTPPESVSERTTRLERKLTVATLVLQGLSPSDSRARLLAAALHRRDEVLLDAVLAGMAPDIVSLATTRRDKMRGQR